MILMDILEQFALFYFYLFAFYCLCIRSLLLLLPRGAVFIFCLCLIQVWLARFVKMKTIDRAAVASIIDPSTYTLPQMHKR